MDFQAPHNATLPHASRPSLWFYQHMKPHSHVLTDSQTQHFEIPPTRDASLTHMLTDHQTQHRRTAAECCGPITDTMSSTCSTNCSPNAEQSSEVVDYIPPFALGCQSGCTLKRRTLLGPACLPTLKYSGSPALPLAFPPFLSSSFYVTYLAFPLFFPSCFSLLPP